MASGEQVTLEPGLTGVFGQDLKDASVMGADELGAAASFYRPLIIAMRRSLENSAQLIAHQLVRGKDAEVTRILRNHLCQIFREKFDRADLYFAAALRIDFQRVGTKRRQFQRPPLPATEGV